jgi:hypothetical protein
MNCALDPRREMCCSFSIALVQGIFCYVDFVMKILKSFDNSADKWKLSLENKVFIAFDAKSLTSCEFF